MTPRPTRWLPAEGNRCRKVRGSKQKMCDGPRRVPEPYGQAANVAEELGLGTRKAASQLLSRAPNTEWVEAVEGSAQQSMLWPVEGGRFGRGFGYTRKHKPKLRHNGIDIGAETGELIRAVNDGIVAYSDNGVRGFGNAVMIIHKDATVSSYCHNNANYVFAGQQVRRGQVIGEVGMTGIARGPHLHFEYYESGRARDPMKRMVGIPSRRGVADDSLLHL
jgi:murein DD-endopeptidase MepM/ murein hydrolase activator NlpD